MDASSSSSSDVHPIKQEEEEEEPIFKRKTLPYHSLLLHLHTLEPQHEFWTSQALSYDRTVPRQETWTVIQEMKFQQMIFMLLQNHGVTSQSIDDIQTMAEAKAKQIRNFLTRFTYSEPYSPPLMVSDDELNCIPKFLETSHRKIKPHLKEFCLRIVHLLLQGNSSTIGTGYGECYGIFKFTSVILFKLKHFKKLKPNLFDPLKKQMQFLEHMLNYAPIIVSKMENRDENLQNFFKFFEPWVNTATAAIVILHWLDENDEKPFAMVSSSLQKFNLNFLQYVKAYILVIKALKPSNASEILVMRNTVEQLIDMILEKFNLSMDDRFDMFREGLAFWTALLVDLPNSDTEHEKLICSQTNLLVDQAESLICSLCLCKHIAVNRNTLLNDFLEKINEAKTEVRQLQVHQIPGLSCNNSLKANTRRHFEVLLANLHKKFDVEAGFLPFEKHLIATVHGELSYLRPYLLDIFELQDGHKDLRDICVQASNIAYYVDYVTDFCLVSIDIPIWSNLMHLYNAIENIQSIKTQVSNIRQDDQMYNDVVMSAKFNSQCVLPTRHEVYDATINDDFKVGFVEEEKRIIDCLVAGEAGLEIVAVIGMGGQGKTHLARRIFLDKSINHHFYKLASCCISQAYDIKKVFKDILEGVGENVSTELYRSLTQEDLADKLRKCLMGQKYLIVLDDMWDVEAWFDFQESFPDNRNGSRILVTSRIHDVALKAKAKANCSIVELHPLSREESWKLLKMKVFHEDCCPPTLIEIGKALAKNCKGLPLAIVVVAGLLKKDKDVESWKRICESLKPLISSEGCMDILELSYKHLPDYLKPCFLYLGAFKEDKQIYANPLIQYWIAEGFVQSDGIKSREVVAKEYLMDLASRNLISIVNRSSRNQIKSCVLHDLLHQLCQIKFEEEKFMLNMLDGSSSTLNNGYCRISVHDKWRPFVDSKPIIPSLRSLINVFVRESVDVSGVVKELKLIRILDLSNVVLTKACFHYITQLIHLRVLAVDCRFPIQPSILNLLKLEVLRITTIVPKPVILLHVVLKMLSLRHIFAEFCIFDKIDCYSPLVPADISSPLSKLESLGRIWFFSKSSFKEVAQSLQNILKLDMCCMFYFHLSSYFKRLESLKFFISYHEEQYVDISPSVLDFPLTLKKLRLSLSRIAKTKAPLSGAMISLIGKLPNLEVLKLEAQFENDRWDVEDDEFLKLKYFSLCSSSIKEWNLSDESFPFLQQLLVSFCEELGQLPDRFGSITTLRRIEVNNCSDSLLDSFQQIVDDQMDAGNEGLQHSIR